MQCYTELIPPTAVTHAVSLPFTGPKTINLVVAKTSLLQIFELKTVLTERDAVPTIFSTNPPGTYDTAALRHEPTTKLVLVAEYNLSGTVTSLSKVKALDTKAGGEALLLAFRDAKLSLVEWDPETRSVVTISIHYYEGDELRESPWDPELSECDNFIVPDPSSRCVALKFGVRRLAILPFRQHGDDLVEDEYDPDFDLQMDAPQSRSKQEEDVDVSSKDKKTPYKPSFVLPLTALDPSLTHPVHLAFLHEYREPTFGLICSSEAPSSALLAERKDNLTYTVFTLDLEQRASTMLLSVPGLPYDIWRIIALPLPIGGSMLIGVNELIHIDQAGKAYGVGVNEFARKCSTFSMHDQSHLAMRLEDSVIEQLSPETGDLLLILKTGELVIISFAMDGRSISGITIQKVSDECGGRLLPGAASCAAHLGRGKLFVGSEDADSTLLGWTTKNKAPQLSRKRSRAQMMVEDAEFSFDEDDLDDDFDDDLYDDEASSKKVAISTVESYNPSQIVFKLQDSLVNFGPMNAFALGSPAPSASNAAGANAPQSLELLASVGRGSAGALGILKREIEPVVRMQQHVADANSIWSVSPRKPTESKDSPGESQFDQYLIVSKAGMTEGDVTTVFSVNGLKLEEIMTGDLERDSGATVDVGILGQRSKIVQVLKHEIRTVDAELGLAQIMPMEENEETGAEIQILGASFADPYVFVIRDDLSVGVYAMDDSGELEEIERGPAIQSSKWLSGCLYTSETTSNEVIAFLLSSEGSFQAFQLPNLSTPLFTTDGLSYLPDIVRADYSATRRTAIKAGLLEILVTDIGDSIHKSPYLIVRTSGDDLYIYQPFRRSPKDKLSFSGGNLRWHKIPQPSLSNASEEGAIELDETATRFCLKALSVGRYSTVFRSGDNPSLILKESTSLPRLIPLRGGPISSMTAFNSVDCEDGFATINSQDSLQLCALPIDFTYGQLGWAARKIPINEYIGSLCYHAQKKVYIAATTKPIDFSLPEDGHHQDWARENVDLLPQTEKCQLRMIDPSTWSVIDTVELEENEIALSLKVLNLEISENSHERKDLVVVGTAVLRGEDLATRGHCHVFEIISVVPEPGRPETNRKLRLIVREEVKGAVTAVSDIGVQGFMIMAQGQKCMVRGLKEDGTLLPVAFMDMQTVVTVLRSLPGTGLVLMGDAARGIWFTGYTEEPYKMILFGKGKRSMEVIAADFLPHDRQLYIVVADADCNIQILQFDPEHPKSLSGARLLHKSTFHTGHFPTQLVTLPSTTQVNSTPINGTEAAEAANAGQYQESYRILLSTQSGALALVSPLDEPSYRRLGALQTFLTSWLDHPCGLNPKAYRAVDSEAFGGRGVLDGNILRRWKELSWPRLVETLGKVGVESNQAWILEADLKGIGSGSLGYL